MAKTSVRLSPEICKKLESEARRLSEIEGETVTVSELIRACIMENFPQLAGKSRRGNATLAELRDEITQLQERNRILVQDVEKLVHTLSELFPLLATREQVDSLTDGIAAVITSLKGR